MNLRQTAAKIPAIIRRERLLTPEDPIYNAVAAVTNQNMMLLAEIWYSYIEPNKDRGYCPVCLTNIKNNFQSLQPELIELEKESILLNEINPV